MDKKKGFKINGTVQDFNTGKGIAGLIVKAFDKDLIFDDLLGAVETDKDGNFEIYYDKEDFQELFFDKKPDIYIKIKNKEGDVIYTTKDKVRYGAEKTEVFNIRISKKILKKEVIMKWNIKKSNELKEKIATNEDIMKELGQTISEKLEIHNVKVDGYSFVFEPRVFNMEKTSVAELMIEAKKAMAIARIEDDDWKDMVIDFTTMKCLPACGPLNPEILNILEKIRIKDFIFDDPVPIRHEASEYMINQIVSNKKLMLELSESIFRILNKHNITFDENEGCVFTPFVFETPVYAQKVGKVKSFDQLKGFGPQVIEQPARRAGLELRIPPLPGVIEIEKYGPIVGVIRPPWWWIGIPDPELLIALDKIRNFKY